MRYSEADLSAIECALQAKRAEETAALIDGDLYE
jgi:hypothetical protein